VRRATFSPNWKYREVGPSAMNPGVPGKRGDGVGFACPISWNPLD
jgi:hypothetical protein